MSLSRSSCHTRNSCATRTSSDVAPRHKRSVDDSLSNTMKSSSDDIVDSQPFKKPNFSDISIPTNGFNRHSSGLPNNKPPSAKKIVIKNLKGLIIYYQSLSSKSSR